jgi:hypothetical protein
MATTVGLPGREVPLGGPLWACHTSTEGRDMLCASWLARVGLDHLSIRLAVAAGRIPAEALTAGEDWPSLYGSFDSLAAANGLPTRRDADSEAGDEILPVGEFQRPGDATAERNSGS